MDFGDRDVARVDAGSFVSAAGSTTGGIAIGTPARDSGHHRRRRDLAHAVDSPTLCEFFADKNHARRAVGDAAAHGAG